ncbi:MAG: hypothetical protein KJ811_03345 [Candidatus Margulisbacteria bacterium]|nr:hypothetical protein [Candidatus Margulisiibacteriota bacterium]
MENRLFNLAIVFILCFALLYLRLAHLQFAEGSMNRKLAIENAAKNVPERAPRGIIYDRYGKVLAENKPVFTVRVLPYVLSRKTQAERERVLDLLSEVLGEKIEYKISAAEPIIVKDNISQETAIKVEELRGYLDGG